MAAAERALELDPSLGPGYAALGTIAFFLEWDWERAEVAFRRSIELDPGGGSGRAAYSMALAFQGRIDDWTAPDQRRMRAIVPENRLRVYEVRDVIETLADEGSGRGRLE